MPPREPVAIGRKERGDYPTPPALVDLVVEATLAPVAPGQVVRVLDPACGDGRFLVAAGRRLAAAGADVRVHGIDVEPAAVAAARANVAAAGWDPGGIVVGDGLTAPEADYDVVVGNPPYRSPLSAGVAGRGGGGPYADLAVAFLDAAIDQARPDGGRVGLVLPQSVLSSRDAAAMRARVEGRARRIWSWWSPARHFDADVVVCALAFERVPFDPGAEVRATQASTGWADVVTSAIGVPSLPELAADRTLGDRARVTANFRDHYYALAAATRDDGDGPPLVTAGLIDPGRCDWGTRPVRLGGRTWRHPRVELDLLSAPMRRWADEMLVPKVLIANQTRVIEAVADRAGAWLPSVPVLTARPDRVEDLDAVVAVVSSAVASCWAWHRAAGTGRSARSVRLGPRWLAELPWPRGDLDDAVAAVRAGHVAAASAAVCQAYGLDPEGTITQWWDEMRPSAARLSPDGSEI